VFVDAVHISLFYTDL